MQGCASSDHCSRLREQSLRIEKGRHLDPEAIDQCAVFAARAGCLKSFHRPPRQVFLDVARNQSRKNRRSVVRTDDAFGAVAQPARVSRFLRCTLDRKSVV